jgi:hypothetical protein
MVIESAVDGKPMADVTTRQKKKPERKPSEAAEGRHQFLAVRNAEVIKSIKVAAEADITTSEMLESAAREPLDRRTASRARRA